MVAMLIPPHAGLQKSFWKPAGLERAPGR